jgi:ABC-2 type transport system permease protein
MALIFAMMGQILSSSQKNAAGMSIVAIVDQDGSSYAATVKSALESGANVVYNGSDAAEAQSQLLDKKGVAMITIPSQFSQRIGSGQQAEIQVLWLMRGTGLVDSMPVGMIEGLIAKAKWALSSRLVEENSTLEPDIVLSPIVSRDTSLYEGKTIVGASPNVIGNLISGKTMFIPVVIMMLIIMGSTSVLTSMGLEKENRTLETLLTLPVRRRDIIVSKIVGSAVVGLIMGAIYMAGFVTYFSSFGGPSGNLADLGFSLNALDYVLIALSLFISLLAALCASVIMGAFASSYRSAQNLTFPLVGVATFVMMVTMFLDFNTMPLFLRAVVFLIPFSHPMIAMKALMLDNYWLVLSGIVYSTAVTGVLVAVAARIFSTDRVIIGISRKRRKRQFVSNSRVPRPMGSV